MAITFVQQKDANGTGTTQTVIFTSNVTAGDLLVLVIAAATAPMTVSSISDTRGNTYTNRTLPTGNDGSTLSNAVYDCVSVGSGANTVSVTVSASGGFLELKVWQFHTTSGTWTYDTGNKSSSASADPAVSGNITTAQAVEALVGFAGIFGTAGSYGSGWTGTNTGSGNTSAYRIASATGTYQYSVAQGGLNRYMASIAGYYAAGAPPTQTFPMAIVDTSAVSLGFHGAAKRFPMAIVDTSAVSLGFHGALSSFTVGPTTHGNSTGAYFGLTASQVTMPQSGTLQSLSINWFSDAGNTFILGVYSDNAGVPGTLLATTAPAVSAVGLQTLSTTTNIGMVSGSKYWLTVQTQNPIGGYFDSTGLGAFYGSQPWTGALPTVWGSSSTGAFTFSLYATLNPGVPTPHFPVIVADTSSATIGFHVGARFQIAVADTSAVTLRYGTGGKHFPVTVADTSVVSLGFHASVAAFTVGPTSPGPSSGAYSGITASQITLTQRALLQSISVFWSVGGAGQPYLLGIYSDVSGSPGALLASSALGTSVVGLNTQSFGAGPELPAGNYWLAVQVNTPISGYFDSTTGLGAFNGSQPWTGALPATFTPGGTGTFTFSLYGTFTPSNNVHFPLKPSDTSSVSLGYHGVGQRFPLLIADTSAVAIGFHQSAQVPFNVGPTAPGNSTGAYNGIAASQVTMAQTGTLQSLSVFWFSDAGGNFLLGVYDDAGGNPGTLLATTAVGVSTIGLQTLLVTATNVVLHSGQKYWLALQTQTGIGGYFDSTTGLGEFNGGVPWTGALPSTFTGSSGTFTFSLYATLTPGIPPLHFPLAVADTSTVRLGFQGAPKRFAMVVADTSGVSIGFHGVVTSTLVARFVKVTATGKGTGLSWTDAAGISIVNSSGASDVCFYLAGGTYPPQGFTASGSSPAHPVYVRRASASDPLCTAGAGWNPAFDAQVIISQGVDLPANFVLDGNKWTAPGMPSTFGIQVTYPGSGGGKGIDAQMGGNIIRNVEVLGPGFCQSKSEYDLIFIGANSLISGCSLHDSDALIKSWAGNSNVTVEYCWMYNVASDIVHTHDPSSSPHPDIWYNSSGVVNLTVRWCVIANVVSEGFFFDHDNGIGGSNMLWYGNLMFQGDTQGDVAGGWGAVPIEFQNNLSFGSVFFYNNTFVDWNKANYLGNGTATIDAASAFKNNLWINCDPGDIPTAKLAFNGFSSTPANGAGANATVNPASPFTGPYNPSPGFSSSGTPPGTRAYPGSPGADPPGYNPNAYLNNFQLVPATSWALNKGASIPPYNTDMFGNTGTSLGCFQTPGGVTPPPGTQHFPLNVADSSHVALGFRTGTRFPLAVADTTTVVLGWHGASPAVFQVVANDTSSVYIGYHGTQKFGLTAADTSSVFLGISHAIQRFPFAVYDFSFVVLGFQNDHYHQPLTVPPYSGITQPININVNADIAYRESLTQDFPQVVPPYAPTPAPLSANEPGNEPGGTDIIPPPIQTTDLWAAQQEWPL